MDAIRHDGETFFATGKRGINFKTGERGAEYESDDTPGRRIWVYESGRILED